jgi:hypothetical protein
MDPFVKAVQTLADRTINQGGYVVVERKYAPIEVCRAHTRGKVRIENAAVRVA